MSETEFGKLKPTPQVVASKRESPLPNFRRGPYDFSDDANMPLICPTCQQTAGVRHHHIAPRGGKLLMYFAAVVLFILTGLFYSAGQRELGSVGVEVCRYGSTFCDSPHYVLVGAILATLWASFVSIR